MTIRRFNYTGRKRIAREDVAITLHHSPNDLAFDAIVDVAAYEFPQDAEVWVEASADWTLMRFGGGTIGAPSPLVGCKLTRFDVSDGLSFTVKVIGVGDRAGLILGEVAGVRPSEPETVRASRSFVDVRPEKLDHLAWRLRVDGVRPVLEVNSSVGDWKGFVRTQAFRVLAAPELFRQLLDRAAADDEDEQDSVELSWESRCLNIAATYSRQALPVPTDDVARGEWIDAAVSAFARAHALGPALLSMIDEERSQ